MRTTKSLIRLAVTQADLSSLAHISEGMFSHVATHTCINMLVFNLPYKELN